MELEYQATVFESSSSDKDGKTKGIHAYPIENGAVVLQISGFPPPGAKLTFEELNEVFGVIFLNRENAVSFANDLLRATGHEMPTLITYSAAPETWGK